MNKLFPYLFLLYTDPGSGALILQLIMAGLIGSLFYIKKIKDRLFGKKEKTVNSDGEQQTQILND